MTTRNAVLFASAKPTRDLLQAWTRAGGAQPLMPRAELLEPDRSGNRHFRALWDRSFPDRDPLPFGPLSTPDGRGTDDFLKALA